MIGYSSNLTLFISPSSVGEYTCHVSTRGYKHIHVSANVYQRAPPSIIKTAERNFQYGVLGETVQVRYSEWINGIFRNGKVNQIPTLELETNINFLMNPIAWSDISHEWLYCLCLVCWCQSFALIDWVED